MTEFEYIKSLDKKGLANYLAQILSAFTCGIYQVEDERSFIDRSIPELEPDILRILDKEHNRKEVWDGEI